MRLTKPTSTALTLVALAYLTGCSTSQKMPTQSEDNHSVVINFGHGKPAPAAANRGHVFYSLTPGENFEEALTGVTQFRITAADENSTTATSKWIKTSEFLDGQNEYVLNTAYLLDKCSPHNSGARLSVTIRDEFKVLASIRFKAENNCTISFFNLLINRE